MLAILLGVLGLIVGGLWLGEWLGPSAAGVALGLILSLRRRVQTLERELARRHWPLPDADRTERSPATPGEPVAPPDRRAVASAPRPGQGQIQADWLGPPEPDAYSARPTPAAEPAASTPQDGLSAILARRWAWILGGNPMVRIGVVVLFFGIAFLLKLAADNALLPIELRLAAVGTGAVALLGLGLRLRRSRPLYALALQGGGVGCLYLTAFAAFRLYGLLPPGPAFALLTGLAAGSAALAVLQEAAILAVLGATGGFLAPVLASAGGGSHLALFSYYLVLNLGILGIAAYRPWRALNLTGFAFTFAIGASWGHLFYRPENFSTTQPFLVAFALIYVAIALLYALRQPLERKGALDPTLVFGVPLAGFGLQAALVQGLEYGLAWSALAAAIFYGGLAAWVLRRWRTELRLLGESFLAIGVVFATLAIPLALDARWTAGLWALEGAAIVWVGRRQGRMAPRIFGSLLQPWAGLSLLRATTEAPPHLPLVNGVFLGALAVAAAGIFAAWQIRCSEGKGPGEKWLYSILLAWGLAWWYGAWILHIVDEADWDAVLVAALAACFSGSALLADALRRRLRWGDLRLPVLALLPGLYLLLPVTAALLSRPFEGWAAAGWVAGVLSQLYLLRHADGRVGGREAQLSRASASMHLAGLWLVLILTAWELAWWLGRLFAGSGTWSWIAWGLVPSVAILVVDRLAERLPWPISADPGLYRDRGLIPVALVLWIWLPMSCLGNPGDSAPLPYLPLLNPLDLAIALALLALLSWMRTPPVDGAGPATWRYGMAPWALGLALFLWLNSAWLRTAHHWLGLPFAAGPLLRSQTVESGLAILWALGGLAFMLLGSRIGRRQPWLAGAALMGLAVAKLFLVDLAGSGTLARIVSFLSVGVLLLVVGYLSPLPPRGEAIGKA